MLVLGEVFVPFSEKVAFYSFPKVREMNIHFEAVHEGKKPHKCPNCESKFSQKISLRRHVESIHERKRPYLCLTCDANFADKNTLKIHNVR